MVLIYLTLQIKIEADQLLNKLKVLGLKIIVQNGWAKNYHIYNVAPRALINRILKIGPNLT